MKKCFGVLFSNSKTCKNCPDNKECQENMGSFNYESIVEEIKKIEKDFGIEKEVEAFLNSQTEKSKTKKPKTEKPKKIKNTEKVRQEIHPTLLEINKTQKWFFNERMQLAQEIYLQKLSTKQDIIDFITKQKPNSAPATIKTYMAQCLKGLKMAGLITIEKNQITWR